jgi:hypothetical protein
MKRVYEILWNSQGFSGRPEGEPKYVFTEQPRSEPPFTHWIWWAEGFLSHEDANLRGRWVPCDQTAAIPVKRVQ